MPRYHPIHSRHFTHVCLLAHPCVVFVFCVCIVRSIYNAWVAIGSIFAIVCGCAYVPRYARRRAFVRSLHPPPAVRAFRVCFVLQIMYSLLWNDGLEVPSAFQMIIFRAILPKQTAPPLTRAARTLPNFFSPLRRLVVSPFVCVCVYFCRAAVPMTMISRRARWNRCKAGTPRMLATMGRLRRPRLKRSALRLAIASDSSWAGVEVGRVTWHMARERGG